MFYILLGGFPGGSDRKESACKAGHLGSSLVLEDSLEKEMATYSSILPGKSYGQKSLAGYSPYGRKSHTCLND